MVLIAPKDKITCSPKKKFNFACLPQFSVPQEGNRKEKDMKLLNLGAGKKRWCH